MIRSFKSISLSLAGLAFMATCIGGMTSCNDAEHRKASGYQTEKQEVYLARWIDGLKKSKKPPFRLLKINGAGCFIGTWGYDGHGGPGLALMPDQTACDNPRYTPITIEIELTPEL